jgi:hypothetical protein
MQGSKTAMTVEEALDAFDREYDFVRKILLPEEDRARLTGARWEGGYRWFRSPNVICLEKARRLKAAGYF